MSQQQPQGKAPAQERTKTTTDPHYLQARFLAACKSKRIRVWFAGPEPVPSIPHLEGVLIGADQFTRATRQGDGVVALVYKSAVAVLRRAEGQAPQ